MMPHRSRLEYKGKWHMPTPAAPSFSSALRLYVTFLRLAALPLSLYAMRHSDLILILFDYFLSASRRFLPRTLMDGAVSLRR